MIKLNKEEYTDKIYACWLGKNIGGTMGTPYEGTRELLDIKGFSTPENVVLPNDDLDLQLVWFRALEEIGVRNLDSKKLGESWVSFISPHWNEYGIGKANMQLGLLPPLSGDYNNSWKDSNGAWIRTEIWASLAPACPDVALKYSYEDACVDHGTGEGTVAAIFIAAMESAAFVESDLMTLINIGLSKIPETSRVAKSIKLLLECFENGKDWTEARAAILEQNKDIGDGWFEAPSNVAYTILGMLYGGGDFKKSMITAINCGDDTDCTGATLGSLMGIMHGTKIIPEDWKKHIGDEIVTVSVSKGILYNVPKTCTELTKRIVKMAPLMLGENKAEVEICNCETDAPEKDKNAFLNGKIGLALCQRPKNSFTIDFNYASATVSFDDSPDIKPNETKKITIHFVNNLYVYGGMPYFLNIRWILPDGWTATGAKNLSLPHETNHGKGEITAEYYITANENTEAVNRLIVEVVANGRPTTGLIPVVLLG